MFSEMTFSFATCNRSFALDFLKRMYPEREGRDVPFVHDLLDYVEKDVIRIQDPMMHSSPQIIAWKNWSDAEQENIVKLAQQL